MSHPSASSLQFVNPYNAPITIKGYYLGPYKSPTAYAQIICTDTGLVAVHGPENSTLPDLDNFVPRKCCVIIASHRDRSTGKVSCKVRYDAGRIGTDLPVRPCSVNQLFTLCNGAILRYWIVPRDTGEAFRTNDTPQARFPLPDSVNVDLWSARTGDDYRDDLSNIQIIAADFDELPPGFNTGNEKSDWNRFRRQLKKDFEYSNKAIVTTSRHGKAKMFFAVDTQNETLTKQSALSVLNRLIPEYLMTYVDHDGLSSTFVTKDMIKDLSAKLPYLRPLRWAILDTAIGPASNVMKAQGNKGKLGGVYRMYQGEIPKTLIPFIEGKSRWDRPGRGSREGIIRILLDCPGLNGMDGFGLSQDKTGRTLGLKTPREASRLLARLCSDEVGFLIDTGMKWEPFKKAKTYVASGVLEQAIREIHGDVAERGSPEPLPTRIPTKEWQSTLWRISFRFRHRPDEFIAWTETLPGIAKGDRRRQARRAIDNRVKYIQREAFAKVQAPDAA